MLSVVTCELVVGNIRQCAWISSPFCQEFTKQCTKPLPLEGLVILRCLCFVFFFPERPNRLDDVILIEGVKLHRKGKKNCTILTANELARQTTFLFLMATISQYASRQPSSNSLTMLWHSPVPLKQKHFLWLAWTTGSKQMKQRNWEGSEYCELSPQKKKKSIVSCVGI